MQLKTDVSQTDWRCSMRYLMLIFIFFHFSLAFADGRDVDYQVGGDTFEGYFISQQKNEPLILLVHDWDGITGYEKRRASMLNELGYSVFVMDLFGKDVRPTVVAEKRKLTKALYSDRQRMRILLEGGLAAAKQLGANVDNAVVAGYCFGGAAVLELARSGADLKGFVSFHGGLTTPDNQDYSKVKSEILVLHGTADTAVSMDDFAELAQTLEEEGIKHEMTTYSGAPHAFTVFGSDRYREGADLKSWQRFTLFLDYILRND